MVAIQFLTVTKYAGITAKLYNSGMRGVALVGDLSTDDT